MVIRYGFSSFLLYCKDQIPWCYYLALLLSLFVSVALTIFIVLSEFPPRAIVSFIEPTLPPLLMILNTILYMYSINTDTTDEVGFCFVFQTRWPHALVTNCFRCIAQILLVSLLLHLSLLLSIFNSGECIGYVIAFTLLLGFTFFF